jgi:hypothetical protein
MVHDPAGATLALQVLVWVNGPVSAMLVICSGPIPELCMVTFRFAGVSDHLRRERDRRRRDGCGRRSPSERIGKVNVPSNDGRDEDARGTRREIQQLDALNYQFGHSPEAGGRQTAGMNEVVGSYGTETTRTTAGQQEKAKGCRCHHTTRSAKLRENRRCDRAVGEIRLCSKARMTLLSAGTVSIVPLKETSELLVDRKKVASDAQSFRR